MMEGYRKWRFIEEKFWRKYKHHNVKLDYSPFHQRRPREGSKKSKERVKTCGAGQPNKYTLVFELFFRISAHSGNECCNFLDYSDNWTTKTPSYTNNRSKLIDRVPKYSNKIELGCVPLSIQIASLYAYSGVEKQWLTLDLSNIPAMCKPCKFYFSMMGSSWDLHEMCLISPNFHIRRPWIARYLRGLNHMHTVRWSMCLSSCKLRFSDKKYRIFDTKSIYCPSRK